MGMMGKMGIQFNSKCFFSVRFSFMHYMGRVLLQDYECMLLSIPILEPRHKGD